MRKRKATTTAWLSDYHLAVEGLLFEIFDYIFGNILNGLETLRLVKCLCRPCVTYPCACIFYVGSSFKLAEKVFPDIVISFRKINNIRMFQSIFFRSFHRLIEIRHYAVTDACQGVNDYRGDIFGIRAYWNCNIDIIALLVLW